jgi:hypothetical protein
LTIRDLTGFSNYRYRSVDFRSPAHPTTAGPSDQKYRHGPKTGTERLAVRRRAVATVIWDASVPAKRRALISHRDASLQPVRIFFAATLERQNQQN